jgi:hypothetical protein
MTHKRKYEHDGLLHKSGDSNKINYLNIKIVDAFPLRDILIKIEKEGRVALPKAFLIQICERKDMMLRQCHTYKRKIKI